jgi:class 3 adenylate cyclase
MHREFRKLLKKAIGFSEFVVVVNLDIRGFSSFSKTVESSEVAVFIKRVYMKLIDEYFSDASFFKPTGDGLLIIIPYGEEVLDEVVINTIRICFQILVDFGSLCANDPMINFEVPRKVGIGLSRGSACRIQSGNKILDYSGKVLNLASRLMDLARPSGIVFDANFGIELFPDELIKLFAKESVYIKGIAEREPIDIYYTKDYTRISPMNKHPVEEVKWKRMEDTKTLKQIKDFGPRFIYFLPSKPVDSDQIKVKITHQGVVRGRKRDEIKTSFYFDNFEYFLEAGKPIIRFQFDALAKRLEMNGVKKNWDVHIEIIYPEK